MWTLPGEAEGTAAGEALYHQDMSAPDRLKLMDRVRHRQGWTGQMVERLVTPGRQRMVAVIHDGNGHRRVCRLYDLTALKDSPCTPPADA